MINPKNIYYMLAYAFSVLHEEGYRDIAVEDFENTAELFSEILIRGVTSQIKRGISKDYIDCTELTRSPKGRIDFAQSIKQGAAFEKSLVCQFDIFSEDFKLNQIIKTTLMLLQRADITRDRKKNLTRLLRYFAGVSQVIPSEIDWHIRYNRNNQTYRMLIGVCQLVIQGLLHTEEDGTVRLTKYVDDQRMSRLYEKFVLEYFKKEHPDVLAHSPHIPWALDDGYNEMLPTMKSDIVLEKREKVLIIDTKYYARVVQENYGTESVHSGNLYQLFTYVKNQEEQLKDVPHQVSGLLLYAQTENTQLYEVYQMSGNEIRVQTLDLNVEFREIRRQLDEIVDVYFD